MIVVSLEKSQGTTTTDVDFLGKILNSGDDFSVMPGETYIIASPTHILGPEDVTKIDHNGVDLVISFTDAQDIVFHNFFTLTNDPFPPLLMLDNGQTYEPRDLLNILGELYEPTEGSDVPVETGLTAGAQQLVSEHLNFMGNPISQAEEGLPFGYAFSLVGPGALDANINVNINGKSIDEVGWLSLEYIAAGKYMLIGVPDAQVDDELLINVTAQAKDSKAKQEFQVVVSKKAGASSEDRIPGLRDASEVRSGGAVMGNVSFTQSAITIASEGEVGVALSTPAVAALPAAAKVIADDSKSEVPFHLEEASPTAKAALLATQHAASGYSEDNYGITVNGVTQSGTGIFAHDDSTANLFTDQGAEEVTETETAAEEETVEEEVTEEEVVEEAEAQEEVAEEPAAEEPVAEEPAAEEPAAEEPAAEEPAAEEPVAEEPVAEEPAATQTTDTSANVIIIPIVTLEAVDPGTAVGGLVAQSIAAESDSVWVSIEMDTPINIPVTVNLSTTANTASASDYNTAAGFSFFTTSGSLIGTGYSVDVPPGETTVYARIDAVDDSLVETGLESFNVNITSVVAGVTGTTTTVPVTIIDNDQPRVFLDSISSQVLVDQGTISSTTTEGGYAWFKIRLDQIDPDDPVTVNISGSHGSTNGIDVNISSFDFYSAAGALINSGTSVVIAPGQQEVYVRVTTNEDLQDEPSETFSVSINSATGAVLVPTETEVGTIIDNDQPTVSISTVSESVPALGGTLNSSGVEGQEAWFKLSFDQPNVLSATVTISTINQSAIAPGDYVANNFDFFLRDGTALNQDSTTVNIAPGLNQDIFFRVTTNDDPTDEVTENYRVEISSVGTLNLGNTSVTPQIFDNDQPVVNLQTVSAETVTGFGSVNSNVVENSANEAWFKLVLDQPNALTATVTLQTSDISTSGASDYTPNNFNFYLANGTFLGSGATVTIPAGTAGPVYVQVNITDDGADEQPVETYQLDIVGTTNVTEGTGTQTATITDNDNAPPAAVDIGSVPTEPAFYNTQIDLTGSFDDPSPNDAPFNVTWTVTSTNGQIIAPQMTVQGSETVPGFSFTPNAFGEYTVTLTVQDVEGAVGQDVQVINVCDFSVTTTTDETTTATTQSLREAIDCANHHSAGAGADTITLGAGTFTLTLGQIDITQDLIIQGAGEGVTIIDQSTLARVFDVANGVTLTLLDLTVQDGAAGAGDGGNINVGIGATLNLTNVTVQGGSATVGAGINFEGNGAGTFDNVLITNNDSTGFGGGVHAETFTTLLIQNSDFTLNDATGAGTFGGALYTELSNIDIINTNFDMNTAVGGGGAIFDNVSDDGIWGSAGFDISGGSFTNNSTDGSGGAIVASQTDLTLTNGTVFDTNIAVNEGGAIAAYNSADIDIFDAVFNQNQANSGGAINHYINASLEVTNTSFTGNIGTSGGGAIVSDAATVTINSSLFTGNQTANDGGALRVQASDLTLINSTISGNTATNGGGAIRFLSDSQTHEISNSTITDNTSTATSQDGVDGSATTSTVTVTSSIIAGNNGDNDVSGSNFVDGGNNLIGNVDGSNFTAGGLYGSASGSGVIDPVLGDLTDNGGPTETHALLNGSPAIDTGAANGNTTDQRGESRPYDVSGANDGVGDQTDIGAFEINPITNLLDDGSGTSLRDAIVDANANAGEDLIVLGSGNFLLTITGSDNNAAAGDLDITDDLVIRGQGEGVTFIDASALSDRVFHLLNNASLTLEDVTILGGNTSGDGGGVLVQSNSTLTVNSVTFQNNTGNSGGAISASGDISINDANFIGNDAFSGGGIYLSGSSTSFITDSTFTGNDAALGGAITQASSTNTTTISNTLFQGNSVTNSGGAIWSLRGNMLVENGTVFDMNTSGLTGGAIELETTDATVIIRDSFITNNVASSDGGGIYTNGNVTLDNTLVQGNESLSRDGGGVKVAFGSVVDINNGSIIDDNTAARWGGGVANEDGSLTISDSIITNNTGNAGAGIGAFGSLSSTIVTNTQIDTNHGVTGGGIYSSGSTTSMTISQSTVSNNDATTGAGIYNAGEMELTNVTISGNTSTNVGGGIANNGASADLTISNSTITANSATNNGDGIYHNGSAQTDLSSTIVAANNGDDDVNGTGFTDSGNNLIGNVDGSNLTAGGLLGSASGSGVVDPLLNPLADNGGPTQTHALQPDSPAIDTGAAGATTTDQRGESRPQDVPDINDGVGDQTDIGAFEVNVITNTADDASGTSLRDAIIQANSSSGEDFIVLGSGTFSLTITGADEDLSATGDLDVTESIVIQGQGEGVTIIDAAALSDRIFDVLGTGVTLTLRDLTIQGGNVTGAGGAVQVNDGNGLILENVTVQSNQASSSGGALFVASGANATISNSLFDGNTGAFGGAIRHVGATDVLTVTDSVFTGNNASGGGVIFNSGIAQFTNVLMSGNSATTSAGGAIYGINTSLTTITNTTISGNHADTLWGGGIYARDSAQIDINASTLSGNTATQGGAIYTIGNSNVVNITNSTLSGNTASIDGGAIRTNGTYTIENSTITANDAPTGSGIQNTFGSVSLTSTIVADNAGDRDVNGSNFIDGGNNLIGNVDGSNLTAGVLYGSASGSGVVDPLLGDLADNGGPTQTHALLNESPAIDTGATNGNTTDQRGETRPYDVTGVNDGVGSQADIGAYEINPITNLLDDGSGTSFRDAIIQANLHAGEDIIVLGSGNFVLTIIGTDNNAAAGDLDITDDLVIRGQGEGVTIIDASALSDRVFHILNNANVTFYDVTIQNGTLTGTDNGAGIYGTGITLSLNNTTLSGNTTTNDGGGIHVTNATVDIIDSTITGNGAVTFFGGGIYADSTDLTITRSNIIGNSSTSGSGISMRGTSTLIIDDSVVSDNTNPYGGGRGNGLDIRGSTNATINNTEIDNNTGGSNGGGIYTATSGIVNIINSTISNNTGTVGAGISNNGGTITLTNSTVSGNSGSNNGGGIYLSDSADRIVNINNSTITDNTGSDGDGIYILGTSASVTITSSIVAGNNGDDDVNGTGFTDSGNNLIGNVDGSNLTAGGLLGSASGSGVVDPLLGDLADNGGPTQTHALLNESPAIDTGATNGNTTDQRGETRPYDVTGVNDGVGSQADIGAYEINPITNLLDDGSGTSFRDAIIQANLHTGEDIIVLGSGNFVLTIIGTDNNAAAGDLDITDDLVIRGQGEGVTIIDASALGDRVFHLLSNANLTLEDVTIIGGNITGDGGGVYVSSNTSLTTNSVTFDSNIASDFGGGVYAQGDVTLNDSTFVDNEGTFAGGGLFVTGNSTTVITDSTFSSNDAGFGGGLTQSSTTSMVTINNTLIQANTASSGGAGIWVNSGNMTIENGSVIDANISDFQAGGIKVESSSATLLVEDSFITNNVADSDGGGIHTIGNLTLDNTLVQGNESLTRDGGGIAVVGTGDANIINGSIIDDNTAAARWGGGISNENGILTISDSFITNNTADSGGGLGLFGTHTTTVTNTQIDTNHGIVGGGIYSGDSTTSMTISESTISNNDAAIGAGIYNAGVMDVTNVTISGNTSTGVGGGIANDFANADLTVSNSTITDNTATNNGDGIYNDGGSGAQTDLSSTIVAANNGDDDLNGTGFTDSGNNLIGNVDGSNLTAGGLLGSASGSGVVDPLLNPLADNGGPTQTHALQPDSPAIDTGAAGSTTTDQRGESRPQDVPDINDGVGDQTDIGAFEVNVITNTADDASGTSLRDAIIQANSSSGEDFIVLGSGTFNLTITGADEELAATGDLDITDNIVIRGQGEGVTFIDAAALADRIFDIKAGVTVTLENLTLSNATNGTIISDNGTLELINVHVTGTSGGSAVTMLSDSSLTVTDSIFDFNHAGSGLSGGALYVDESDVVISNSTFDQNSGANGGSMYFTSTGAAKTVLIENNTMITNNTATGDGVPEGGDGAGFLVGGNVAVTVNNSTISGNFTDNGWGGGVRVNDATASVVFNSSTVTGNEASAGGGIQVLGGASVELYDSFVTDNIVDFWGAGLRGSYSGSFLVNNTEITGNDAGANGGGIDSYDNITITIENGSLIDDNTAGDAAGGVAAFFNGTLTISDSTISNNTATNKGGGIIVSESNATLTNVNVTGNMADEAGGIFVTLTSELTVTNSHIDNNTANTSAGIASYSGSNTIDISGSTISGNMAGTGSGALTTFGTTNVNIDSTTISGNTQSTVDDGVGGLRLEGGEFSITNSTISGNTGSFASGVRIVGSTNAEIINTTISGNTGIGTFSGMGLEVNGSTLTLANSTVTENTGIVDGVQVNNSGVLTISSSVISQNGTGQEIYTTGGGSVVSSGNNFVGNAGSSTPAWVQGSDYVGTDSAPLDAQLGSLADNGGLTQTHAPEVLSTLVNNGSNLQSLTTDQRGVGFIRENPTGLPDIGAHELDLTFVSVTTDGTTGGTLREAIIDANNNDGGIIMLSAGTFTLSLTGTDEDAALTGDLDILKDITIVGQGEGVTIIDAATIDRIFHLVSGDLTLYDLTLTNGQTSGSGATADGAAIRAGNSNKLTIDGVTFSNNTAAGQGGAIAAQGATIDIDNATFTGNNAADSGGAFAMVDSFNSVTIDNSYFEGNGSSTPFGGAIKVSHFGPLTVTSSTFYQNSATGGGGVFDASGALNQPIVFNDSYFIDNSTPGGGGAVSARFGISFTANNTIFSGNSAGSGGAIVTSNAASVTLNDSLLLNNSATGNGGAVHLNENNTLTLNNTIVTNNSANNGAGISITNNSSGSIYNSLIDSNVGVTDGGGIRVATTGTVLIQNTTISNNTTDDGGAVYNEYGTVNIINSTLSGNSVTDEGGAIFNDNIATAVINIDASTITENTAVTGAGIHAEASGGSIVLTSTIVDGNFGDDIEGQSGDFTSGGYNLIGDDSAVVGGFTTATGDNVGGTASLGVLEGNGGFGPTHLATSGDTIDTGTDVGATTDQRGSERDYNSGEDIGAVEYDGGSTVTNDGTTFLGTDTANTINGNTSDNIIEGFAGNDVINASDGNDEIDGGSGADIIDAGDGDDFIDGGEGYVTSKPTSGYDDILNGGDGDDTFIFDSFDTTQVDGGAGVDTFRIYYQGENLIASLGGSNMEVYDFTFTEDTTMYFNSGLISGNSSDNSLTLLGRETAAGHQNTIDLDVLDFSGTASATGVSSPHLPDYGAVFDLYVATSGGLEQLYIHQALQIGLAGAA